LDFSLAKKILKQNIDLILDHACAVPTLATGLEFKKRGDEIELSFANFRYRAPAQAFTLLSEPEINLHSITKFLEEKLFPLLPTNITKLKIELSEDTSFGEVANFRYSHGLRYHDGNCQRLFHGHRNPIQVFVQGLRMPSYEQFLAKLCEDVHFVAAENLLNRFAIDLPLETRSPQHPLLGEIRYRSTQGEFFGEVPVKNLIVLADEPSIENIAAFALKTLQKEFSLKDQRIEVRAFEGLNKGAIATSH
jgi:isocitrate dehydrogenase